MYLYSNIQWACLLVGKYFCGLNVINSQHETIDGSTIVCSMINHTGVMTIQAGCLQATKANQVDNHCITVH